MALWTDLIDPATLTGYVRASLQAYEERKGTLARWLPNRYVTDIVARFVAGSSGLIPVAEFRAYDAPPTMGKRPPGKRVTIELPALGQEIPVSEYEQIRNRNASEELQLKSILATTDAVVTAVSDAIERMRGIVLNTGKATITQAGGTFSDDDFGRAAGHTVTLSSLWSSAGIDRLAAIQDLVDIYNAANGEDPGCMVFPKQSMRALAAGNQFQTQLVNGVARPPTQGQVAELVEGAGLPPIFTYDRQVSVAGVTTRVIPSDRILLLPAPVDVDDWQGTDLGATFWGQTLTSTDPSFGIEDVDQPGIVAGVYRNEKPPMIAEVISDAIGLPVLANANRSMSVKVV